MHHLTLGQALIDRYDKRVSQRPSPFFMLPYQHDFIALALDYGVLRFGKFRLKSGRQSPYFFNSGLFNTGAGLAQLGRFYAQSILRSGVEVDMLYGPAYKGIPLVATVSIALHLEHNIDLPYCFNRKESKDHGEMGLTVGAGLTGRVMVLDDVISAGTSVRESVHLINQAGASVAGIAIALDRQERGTGPRSAIEEIEHTLGVPVISIITLNDLIEYVGQVADLDTVLPEIEAYRQRYGTV